MSLSLKHSVCTNCSLNTVTVTDQSTGSSSGVTDESITITLVSGDEVVFDLFADGISMEGGSFVFTPINSTAASVGFVPVNGADYVVFVVYTDSNGDVQVVSYSYTSSSTSFSTIGTAIAALITAGSGTTGVSASYNSTTRNVDLVGSAFGVGIVSDSTTSLSVSNVSAELITDGLYEIEWSLTDSSGANSYIVQSMFLCNVECCVRSKMSNLSLDCGCSGSKSNDAAMEAMTLLYGIQWAISCGKTSKAQKTLEELQAICNNECKSC